MSADKYLSFSECINILSNTDKCAIIPTVPSGIKSNVYFVVSMTDNNERTKKGERRVFHDDCGAWSHTRGYNSVVVGDSCKELYEKDGLVCDRKRVNGKDQLLPLATQPEPSEVRKVVRYYYKLKRCNSYTKRITMLSGSDAYLSEYVGTFPSYIASHGNCVSEGSQYVRTHPDVRSSITEHCVNTKLKPKQILTNMTLNAEDEIACPRNLKQVQNVSTAVNAQLVSNKQRGTNNLADEILTLCSQIADNDFVRCVSFTSEHAPCVILYTDDQLNDIERFCGADAPDAVSSVLDVDRTFNISSLFLL